MNTLFNLLQGIIMFTEYSITWPTHNEMLNGRFTIVVAYDQGRVIGVDNKLPWNIPEDMAHFARYTSAKNIVMGRKTFESIGRPLPNRRNIVVSRNPAFTSEGVEVVGSLQAALDLLGSDRENCLIGGGSLYKEALDEGLVDCIVVSEVAGNHAGDTYFPEINPDDWKLMYRSKPLFKNVRFAKYFHKRLTPPMRSQSIDTGTFSHIVVTAPTVEDVSSDKGVARGIQPVRGEFTSNIGEVMEGISPPHDPLRYLRYSLKMLQEKLGGTRHLIDGNSLRSMPKMNPELRDFWLSSLKEVVPQPNYRFIIDPFVNLKKHSTEVDLELFHHLAKESGMDLKGVQVLTNPLKRRSANKHLPYSFDINLLMYDVEIINIRVFSEAKMRSMKAARFLDFMTHPVTRIERSHGRSMHFKSIATNHRIRKLAMMSEYNHRQHHEDLQKKHYFVKSGGNEPILSEAKSVIVLDDIDGSGMAEHLTFGDIQSELGLNGNSGIKLVSEITCRKPPE